MLPQDITLNTQLYSTTTTSGARTVRSIAGLALERDVLLTTSHEVSKAGRVSSVHILDTNTVLTPGEVSITDNVKMLFKLQYNPKSGNAAIATEIASQRIAMQELLADDSLFSKFLNLES